MRKPWSEGILFPFMICMIMAATSVVAHVMLEPTGLGIFNIEIIKYAKIAGYAVGPIIGLLSFLLIGLLNLARRIVRLRKKRSLHALIVLLGIMPWLIYSWVILGEPRYTPIAVAIIDFIARPMLWGSLIASLLTLVVFIYTILPQKK